MRTGPISCDPSRLVLSLEELLTERVISFFGGIQMQKLKDAIPESFWEKTKEIDARILAMTTNSLEQVRQKLNDSRIRWENEKEYALSLAMRVLDKARNIREMVGAEDVLKKALKVAKTKAKTPAASKSVAKPILKVAKKKAAPVSAVKNTSKAKTSKGSVAKKKVKKLV